MLPELVCCFFMMFLVWLMVFWACFALGYLCWFVFLSFVLPHCFDACIKGCIVCVDGNGCWGYIALLLLNYGCNSRCYVYRGCLLLLCLNLFWWIRVCRLVFCLLVIAFGFVSDTFTLFRDDCFVICVL